MAGASIAPYVPYIGFVTTVSPGPTPSPASLPTLFDTISANPSLTYYAQLLVASGLDAQLRAGLSVANFTAFAPSDASLAAFAGSLGTTPMALIADAAAGVPAIGQLLAYTLAKGAPVMSSALTNGMRIATEDGEPWRRGSVDGKKPLGFEMGWKRALA